MSISVDSKHVKALALDLDGTVLAPGAVLSGRTAGAIQLCMRRGIRIIIATGRSIEGAEFFRASLGAEGPMVYYNGAVIADMPGSKILNATLMSVEAAKFCVDLSRETGVYCQVYFPGENSPAGKFPAGTAAEGRGTKGARESGIRLVTDRDSPEREMYREHTGILAERGDLKELLARAELAGCVKAMFLAEPEILAEIRPKLEERLAGGAYIAQTHRTFLEVLDAKVSKGAGLQFIMERLSLAREEVIAFGDEENDLPMFGAAGFSVAPANAKDSVKARANLIAGPNTEDGVAVFLEDFFGL